jgi:hypothetical protein
LIELEKFQSAEKRAGEASKSYDITSAFSIESGVA